MGRPGPLEPAADLAACTHVTTAVLRPRMREILEVCAQADVPAGMTLMRLAAEAESQAELQTALTAAVALPRVGQWAAELTALGAASPNAWRVVRSVLSEVAHDATPLADADAAIAQCAAAFDRAARVSPEASVALYSFGDPDRLAVATAEVTAQMRAWGLLGGDRVLLEIGCGIGRFPAALAGEAARIIGLDISPAMVAEARRRCAGHANVEIRLASGRDLAGIADASIDCVFAIDAFPYLVQIGMPLVETHFREIARVLRPGGDVLVVNFSYRGDENADLADVRRLATASGFQTMVLGERPFRSWDGRAFRLRKPG